MAASVLKLSSLSRQILSRSISQNVAKVPSRNTQVFTEAGGVCPKPEKVKFGLAKVLLVVCPFVYIGATISKNGAAFLEENDIFVPDDDDD